MFQTFEVELSDGRYYTVGATLKARDGEIVSVKVDEAALGGTQHYRPIEKLSPELVGELGRDVERQVEEDPYLAQVVRDDDADRAREADDDRQIAHRREERH